MLTTSRLPGIRMAVVTLAVIGVITAVTTALRGPEPQSSTQPVRAPGADVAAFGYNFAAQNGEPDPTSMQVAYTDGLSAERLVYDRAATQGTEGEVAVIVARGSFTATMASRPQGAKPPTGTELHVVLDPVTLAVKAWGLSNNDPDLSSVGTPISLSRP